MMRFFSKCGSVSGSIPVWSFLVGLSAVLAFTGPFGTFDAMSLPWRLAYWAPIVFGAYIFVRLSNSLVHRWAGDLPPLLRHSLKIFVFSATYAPAIWAFGLLFAARFETRESFLFIFLNVAGATAIVGYLAFFTSREIAVAPDQKSNGPRLLSRLPHGTTASIMHLTVDDHYVQAYLDDGTTHRLLMRLSDAVNEMDDTPGFCTHRSHWVASAYVQGNLREKAKDLLVLKNGTKVPVSKTYRENVTRAGFL